MKYDQKKPTIMVGYEENHIMNDLADEVTYGIEEEGCLYEKYILQGTKDIRMGFVGVTVILYDEKGFLYVSDLKGGAYLYSIHFQGPEAYRRLGQNAARYLKNMKLDIF